MPLLNYVENSYTFAKFIIELVALAVKSGLTVSFKYIFLVLQQHYMQD